MSKINIEIKNTYSLQDRYLVEIWKQNEYDVEMYKYMSNVSKNIHYISNKLVCICVHMCTRTFYA